MKTIDLCCGIGGIRRGFELAGDFENVLSAEKDEYACRTYQHLFGDDPRHDVTDEAFKELVTRTEYDVLLAGFPCQAFSKVGLRKGFRDVTKGTIFFDIAEIIDRTMPKVVFLENVENLVSHNKGETFRIILNTLENELNYHVIGVERDEKGELTFDKKSFIRNTKNFGLPQKYSIRFWTFWIPRFRRNFSFHPVFWKRWKSIGPGRKATETDSVIGLSMMLPLQDRLRIPFLQPEVPARKEI